VGRKVLKKGLNELMVVLVLIAIAIPVAFVIQSWLTGQASKTPELPDLAATASVRKQGTGVFVTLTIVNNGKKLYRLMINNQSPSIVLSTSELIIPDKVFTGDRVIDPSVQESLIDLEPKTSTSVVLYYVTPGSGGTPVEVMMKVVDDSGNVRTLSVSI